MKSEESILIDVKISLELDILRNIDLSKNKKPSNNFYYLVLY